MSNFKGLPEGVIEKVLRHPYDSYEILNGLTALQRAYFFAIAFTVKPVIATQVDG